MTTSYQNTISYVLLALMGLMVLLTIAWIVYRLIVYIREDIMGIMPKEEEVKPKESSKHSKYNYEKIKMPTSKKTEAKFTEKVTEKDQEMISELNIKDE